MLKFNKRTMTMTVTNYLIYVKNRILKHIEFIICILYLLVYYVVHSSRKHEYIFILCLTNVIFNTNDIQNILTMSAQRLDVAE